MKDSCTHMEYKLYHENVVQRHRVVHVGWPQNIPFKNLSECSSSLQELQNFLKKLDDGKTYWDTNHTITEKELNNLKDERQKQMDDGKIAPRAPRRCHSDYGKKRKQGVPLSEDKESEAAGKQKRRKYKSAPIIESDDEAEDED